MRTANTSRPSRLLRVREFSDKPPGKVRKNPPKSGKSRFIAPFYFSAEDQSQIRAMLKEAGISDPEGHTLFITAAEYEVGAQQLAVKDAPPSVPAPVVRKPTAAEQSLKQLDGALEQVLQALASTGEEARQMLGRALSESDTFRRGYDAPYFDEVNRELERLLKTCRGLTPAAQAQPMAISESAKKFLHQLARIFAECLEVKLESAAVVEVFCRILCIIRKQAEIQLPCEPSEVAPLLSNSG